MLGVVVPNALVLKSAFSEKIYLLSERIFALRMKNAYYYMFFSENKYRDTIELGIVFIDIPKICLLIEGERYSLLQERFYFLWVVK